MVQNKGVIKWVPTEYSRQNLKKNLYCVEFIFMKNVIGVVKRENCHLAFSKGSSDLKMRLWVKISRVTYLLKYFLNAWDFKI